MTVLTDVLDGVAEPAIYRVPGATQLADVEATVADAGWQLVHLDSADATNREAVMSAMRSAFGFGEWLGGDLEALAEALTDVRHERGTVLLWDHPSTFADPNPAQFNAVLSVLLARARSTTGGAFVTLLHDPHGDTA